MMKIHNEDMWNESGNQSKLYLSIAKIENFNGKYDSAKAYIQKSIDTALPNNDEDDKYNTAMAHIQKIISNNADSDTEDVKNVPLYVRTVIDNILPGGMSESIEQSAENYSYETEENSRFSKS